MKIQQGQTSGHSSAEVSPTCAAVMERINAAATMENFIAELNKTRHLQTVLGKTDLARWSTILDRCDEVLEDATRVEAFRMKVDTCAIAKYNCMSTLGFTSLLFECTSNRRIYASVDRILDLLECSDLDVLAEVLRLLQIISKRSKFLSSKICPSDQQSLIQKLTTIAQCWGGKLRSVKMDECVKPELNIPPAFPMTFTDDRGESLVVEQPMDDAPLLLIVHGCINSHAMDEDDRFCLLARIRMLRGFENQDHRMRCLITRLLSISTLIYLRCQPEEAEITALLYPGFIEETAALLRTDLTSHPLVDAIQTEALHTLCSIVSLEKAPRFVRIAQMLESLSALSYHGFLAVFTRRVVDDLKANRLGKDGNPSEPLSTALFSLIYHLSSIEPGTARTTAERETLVSTGLTQSLLSVIAHHDLPLERITFATRCTRIIDIFTTIDFTGFSVNKGMDICIARLVHEVDQCRKEQPFVIDVSGDAKEGEEPISGGGPIIRQQSMGLLCHQQRLGLIKGLLTFIKRAIQDNQFQDLIRHIMEGALPDALIHIISNANYYTASVYHHATQLVTNFIYQEPQQLTSLQNRHVPYVILQSMLRKELPNSRDVISQLGNVFTALCLNERGLKQFKSYDPFEHIFKIVLSIKFIVTMKKKRSEMNDTASGIGLALDDLLRTHPSLKPSMLDALIMTLERLLEIGSKNFQGPKVVMALSKSASKAASQSFGSDYAPNAADDFMPNMRMMQVQMSPRDGDEESEDEDEGEMSMDDMAANTTPTSAPTLSDMGLEMDCPAEPRDGTRLLPLGDYLLIFTKIFETIITHDGAADMVEQFVNKGGVEKVLQLCHLPTLATELAASPFSQSVANVMKFILSHVRSCERLMNSIMSVFVVSLATLVHAEQQPLPPLPDTPSSSKQVRFEGASNLVPMGNAAIVDAITQLNNTVPILASLTKTIFTGQFSAEIRNKVWDSWQTKTGSALHSGFRKVARTLAWETALLKTIDLEPSKLTVSTQTESGDMDSGNSGEEQMTSVSTPEPEGGNNVTSEAVEKPAQPRQTAWEAAGISPAEHEFWHRYKSTADLVVGANKALHDLLNLLARSCYIPSRRSRRYDYSMTTMGKSAQNMADMVFQGFYRDLKWESVHKDSPLEFGRLCDLISQLPSILFDERHKPYHFMLQRFYLSGCHQAFCEVMKEKLAPSLGPVHNPALEKVMVEWLRLAGRLANKFNMMNTPFRQPQPQASEFDIDKYSKVVSFDFFRTFTFLFNKLSEPGVDLKSYQLLCENAISVYKEVAPNLKEDTNIVIPNSNLGGQRDLANQVIPEEQVQQLVDMGFLRQDVLQALMTCPTAQDATEWLIARGGANQPGFGGDAPPPVPAPAQAPVVVDEPVAMEPVDAAAPVDAPAPANASAPVDAPAPVEEPVAMEESVNTPMDAAAQALEAVVEAVEQAQAEAEPRAEENANTTRQQEEDEDDEDYCPLKVEETVPLTTVIPLKDLQIEQVDASISKACIELMPLCERLMQFGSDLVFSCADLFIGVVEQMDPAWRKHQLVGQFMIQEIIMMARRVMDRTAELANHSQNVKELATRIHFACLIIEHVADEYLEEVSTKPILGTLIMLLDYVLDNFSRENMENGLLSPVLLWFELYDKCVRALRRRNLLVEALRGRGPLKWWSQTPEEERFTVAPGFRWSLYPQVIQDMLNKAFMTGKPALIFKNSRKEECTVNFIKMKQTSTVNSQAYAVNVSFPADGPKISVEELAESEREPVWTAAEKPQLISLACRLLAKGLIHHTAAHSILSFALRLTRDYQGAYNFLMLGGVTSMIQLRSSTTPSTVLLTSLILRQCIDDDALMKQSFEKAIRMMTSTAPPTPISEYLGMAHSKPKEWTATLNKLAPLSNRNPALFIETMHKIARIDGKNMSTVPAKLNMNQAPCNEQATQILDLLLREVLNGEWPVESSVPLGHTRMLSRGAVLGLLSELVKTYYPFATMICEYKWSGESVIHVLIEKFIVSEEKETTSSLKTLISILASCNHSPKAQEALVVDIKQSLASIGTSDLCPSVICQKVSELCSLMIMMVDSCPPTAHHPTAPNQAHPQRHPPNMPNTIMKLFHKKRVCNDVVKTITYLQLSRKDSIDTVNQILKTLDSLMKSMNSPSQVMANTAAAERNRTGLALRRYNEFGLLRLQDALLQQAAFRSQTAHLNGAQGAADGPAAERRGLMEDEDPASLIGALLQQGGNVTISRQALRQMRDNIEERVNYLDEFEGYLLNQRENRGAGAAGAGNNEAREDGPANAEERMDEDGDGGDDDDEDEDGSSSGSEQAGAGGHEGLHDHDEVEEDNDDEDEDEEDEHHEDEEAMDEEAAQVEDSMSSGEEDGDDQTDEAREGEHAAEERVGADRARESADDGEEEEEEEEEEMESYHENDFPDDEDDFLNYSVNTMEMFDNVDHPIVINGVGDEWDIFAALHRRDPAPQRSDPPAATHPLLTRPTHIADHQAADNMFNHPMPNYRLMLTAGFGGGNAVALSRQNAIRRIHGGAGATRMRVPAGASQLFDRLFDLGGGHHIPGGSHGGVRTVGSERARFSIMVSGRSAAARAGLASRAVMNALRNRAASTDRAAFRVPLSASTPNASFLDSPEERRFRYPAVAPTVLERLSDSVAITDPLSVRYVGVFIEHYVTEQAEKQEKEDQAKAKAEADAKKAAAAEKEAPKTSETAAAVEATSSTASTSQQTGQEGAPNAEAQAANEEPMDTTDGDQDVSMDDAQAMSTAATAASSVPEDIDPEEMGSPLRSPSGNQQQQEERPTGEGVVEAAAARAVAMEEERNSNEQPQATEQPETTAQNAEAAPQAGDQAAPTEAASSSATAPEAPAAAAEPAPAAPVVEIPEEYRAILGDIVIPDGVDPAFLAALPEDMRAEVIRDHERQQRAQQRAANPPPAPVVPDDAVAAAAAVIPAVQPIDQEFLAALPLDLQEEILAQHGREVREAEEAARRLAAQLAAPPQPEMDGAAVIASLPPGERAVVLAEMDDAELARLPAEMQDEARQARATHYDPHNPMLRYHRLMLPRHHPRAMGRGPAGIAAAPAVGGLAGHSAVASPQAVQLLDKDSILTLCMLFLLDNRLSVGRLQKVLKNVCSHAASCDFAIWCLISLLDKASAAGSEEDEIISLKSWLESITVSGVGHNERAVKISRDASKVSIHSLLSVSLSRNLLETLSNLAKSYPGHFLPVPLRKSEPVETVKEMPPLGHFWQLVQAGSTRSLTSRDQKDASGLAMLDASPLAVLLNNFDKPVITMNGTLQDKLLKVISSVVQTLPNNSVNRLKLADEDMPLKNQLLEVIRVLTTGACTQDGLSEGRVLLIEAMRAFHPRITDVIYEQLFVAVDNVGHELLPQVRLLTTALKENAASSSADSNEPSTSAPHDKDRRATRGRFDGEKVVVDGDATKSMLASSLCKELQLPAVMALTDKTGAQAGLLRSLQTLVRVRDTMRLVKELRKREEEKEAEAARQEAARVAAAAAAAVDAARAAAADDAVILAATNAAVAAAMRLAETLAAETPMDTTSPPQPSTATEATTAENTVTTNAAETSATNTEPVVVNAPSGDATATSPATATPAPAAPSTSEPAAAAAEPAPSAPSTSAPAEEPAVKKEEKQEVVEEPQARLSQKLEGLNDLWSEVSECLMLLGRSSDPHAVLALQPAAEAFFLVHALPKSTDGKQHADEDPDTVKLVEFAERHREVLNQVLRQNSAALVSGGAFSVLTQFPKLLDFDVKRKYFRKELSKMDGDRAYRRNDVNVQVRRSQIFADSFRELLRLRPQEWKNRFYIIFQGEEGQDAGGLLREWFSVITREIFNPNYALFITAPGDMVTYMINKASYINPEHLDYFKFVGRLIAKAIYDNKLLDCYFTRAFYKHILNLPVKYKDIESEDPAFYKSLEFLLNNPINDMGLDLTFSLEVEEFGVRSIRDLKEDGRKIDVTDENKEEYVNLVCQMKMTGSIRKQLDAFLGGFYEIIPKTMISMFNEQELELLISGLPDVDIDDLMNNTEYRSYTKTSPQIQWFWRALRSFEPEDRAKFLQFVTGTSKVPLQGFASLEGMNGTQKFSIHMDSRGGHRLPAAHTCFNQIDLPQYESYERLREALLTAIRECTEGFGFA